MTLAESIYGKIVYVSGEDAYSDLKVISAAPNDGYTFIQWTGDVDDDYKTSNPLSVEFTSGVTYKDVAAMFKQDKSFSLIASSSPYGEISITENPLYPREKIAYATAHVGHVFSEWIGDPDYVTDSNKKNNPITIIMTDAKNVSYIEAAYSTDLSTTVIRDVYGKIIFSENVVGSLSPEIIGRIHPDVIVDAQMHSVVIGKTVSSISNKCFMNCINLEHIYIHSPLYAIGEYAFYNTSLRDFDFKTVDFNYVGQYAFSCTKLQNVNIGFSFSQSIPDNCFSENVKLSSVSLSTSSTSIDNSFGSMCFAECPHLSVIDFSKYTSNLPAIHDTTFDPVGSIDGRVIQLNSIRQTQYAYDDLVWSAFYEDIQPQLVFSNLFNLNVYDGSYISFSARRDSSYSEVNVKFGDTSTSSYTDAFINISHIYNNSNSQTHIVIDNSISALNMRQCTQLTSIVQLGSNVKLLAANAFTGTSLQKISIPSTVDAIGNPMMQLNVGQSAPYVNIEDGSHIDMNWAVLHNGSLVNLFGKDVSRFNALAYPSLTHITMNSFYNCPSLTSISLPNSITSINAPIVDLSKRTCIQEVSIQDGGMFKVEDKILMSNDGKLYLAQQNVENIPTSAVEIMPGAFVNTLATSILCPPSVSSVNQDSFWGNTMLTSIAVPGIPSSTAKTQLEEQPWIYGGPISQVIDDDEKQMVTKVQITCSSDEIVKYAAITDEQGYLIKPLDPNKVKCLTISLQYLGSSHPLPGMNNDSTRISDMLEGFCSSTTKLIDSSATIANVKANITSIINSLGKDQLFIFHMSGYSNNSEIDGRQYITLYNGNLLYDDELWGLFKNAKCHILAIFCTCQSETTSLVEEDEDEIARQISWANSADYYFSNLNESLGLDPKICVYAPCSNGEVAYMQSGVGHCLLTSISNNFSRNNTYDSYESLFYNATTSHETSRLGRDNISQPDYIHPQIYMTDNFHSNVRVFT